MTWRLRQNPGENSTCTNEGILRSFKRCAWRREPGSSPSVCKCVKGLSFSNQKKTAWGKRNVQNKKSFVLQSIVSSLQTLWIVEFNPKCRPHLFFTAPQTPLSTSSLSLALSHPQHPALRTKQGTEIPLSASAAFTKDTEMHIFSFFFLYHCIRERISLCLLVNILSLNPSFCQCCYCWEKNKQKMSSESFLSESALNT